MTVAEQVEIWNAQCNTWSGFELLATQVPCIRAKVVSLYKSGYPVDGNTVPVDRITNINSALSAISVTKSNINLSNRKQNLNNFNESEDNDVRTAANWVIRTNGQDWVRANILEPCAAKKQTTSNINNSNTSKETQTIVRPDANARRPFDRRLDRLESSFSGDSYEQSGKSLSSIRFVPFSYDFAELSTTGYLINKNTLNNKDNSEEKQIALQKAQDAYNQMVNDAFYKGVPALQNYYALVRLYGSDGGQRLVNQKNQRRWYEVDTTSSQAYNFTSTPTTSALISWGNGDPYGRTPYQFTDFVFSKYWNKIQNNRLITLRRYAAPILDNLKFPGMISETVSQNTTTQSTGKTTTTANDSGTSKTESVAFPPMATAITYFGGDTGNSLSSILRFTTGVLWDEVQAGIWDVNTDSVPSNESGPGKLFGGVAKFAEMLNVAGGNFDTALVMNNGQLPPDPYENGPYENRIKGPINRIDTVKKRAPGLAFEWDGLSLVFEYAARPVGGINPKAALLDIMGNFLVMGSASAVFFGGAHRFMANPAKYPFLGGQEGIEKWYKGDPIGWGLTAINQFTQGGATPSGGGSAEAAATNIFKNVEGFFNQLFSGEKGNIFGAISSLFTGAGKNFANNLIAKKTGGQVPYLQGMKAILTGEPVGEWHVTVGNPLNPIAMIGNLICENITVEFNEELGPDDFPTEMKITVKLKHAMNRDRDAIESVFNRGMGRIYNLPDSMSGSADFQTTVDNATKEKTNVGYMPNRRAGIMYSQGEDSGYISKQQVQGSTLSMGGETSVWSRSAFSLAYSDNSATQFVTNENDLFLSSYRAADWIAQRSLS